jgi:hypothetical protein
VSGLQSLLYLCSACIVLHRKLKVNGLEVILLGYIRLNNIILLIFNILGYEKGSFMLYKLTFFWALADYHWEYQQADKLSLLLSSRSPS